MSESLFSSYDRTDHAPAWSSDNQYSFLDRSARPAAAAVRHLLDRWTSELSPEERRRLISRLRSEFDSTFHELWLQQILRALFDDVHAHPRLPHTSRTPDFAVTRGGRVACYIEAKVFTELAQKEAAEDAMYGVLFDAINRMDMPEFFVSLRDLRNDSGKQPSSNRLTKFIRECAETVDSRQARRRIEAGESLGDDLSWNYDDPLAGFRCRVHLFPCADSAVGGGHRPIASGRSKGRWGNSATNIRASLEEKAKRYDRKLLAAPYLIALNSMSPWDSPSDYADALYGDVEDKMIVNVETGDLLRREVIRRRNGLWISENGPQYREVSAILYSRAFPWNLGNAPLVLYINPWALQPLPQQLLIFPRAELVERELTMSSGATTGELLNLDVAWPGKLF